MLTSFAVWIRPVRVFLEKGLYVISAFTNFHGSPISSSINVSQFIFHISLFDVVAPPPSSNFLASTATLLPPPPPPLRRGLRSFSLTPPAITALLISEAPFEHLQDIEDYSGFVALSKLFLLSKLANLKVHYMSATSFFLLVTLSFRYKGWLIRDEIWA